ETQRVPNRLQFEVAVTNKVWYALNALELIECQIFLSSPKVNLRQIRGVSHAVYRVSGDWQEFAGAPSFAERIFFASESRVDQSQEAECSWEIRLLYRNFFDLASGLRERNRGLFFFSPPASHNSFPVCPRNFDAVVHVALCRISCQRARNCLRRAFAQRVIDVFNLVSYRRILFHQCCA